MLNFFSFSSIEISGAVVIVNIVFASVVCTIIALTHRKTHTGLSYSSSYFTSLILMGVVACIVLMVVQNNIFGALGLLGAFSFIRFRTVIKETRDIAFLFFSLAEGVAVGLGHYAIVVISTPLLIILVYLINKFDLGSFSAHKFILMLTSSSPLDEKSLKQKFQSKNMPLDLLNTKRQAENVFEYIFSVHAKDMSDANKLLNEVSASYSITKYEIISDRESIAY